MDKLNDEAEAEDLSVDGYEIEDYLDEKEEEEKDKGGQAIEFALDNYLDTF